MTRVTVIGAGPVGLDAALAARAAGARVTVYERGEVPGSHVRAWGGVRMFTPWDWNVSDRMRLVLGTATPSGAALPTGAELAERLLDPVALGLGVRTGTRVLGIARRGVLKHELGNRAGRPFALHIARGGEEAITEADVVIDASGTYGTPNRLGEGGIDALGEATLGHRIIRTVPDARALAGRTVLVTGSGHSAQTAVRDLTEIAREAPATRVIWATRSAAPDFGAVPGDPLPARAALHRDAAALAAGGAVEMRRGCTVQRVAERHGRIVVTLGGDEVVVDAIAGLHGYGPDASLYRQLQVHECYATLGPMKLASTLTAGDCLSQPAAGADTLDNPEPGFFILGAKSYGRNGQFLLRTGYEQVDALFSAWPRGGG